MGEDDFIYWQDVLDDIAAGKRSALRCPFCQAVGVKVEPKGPLHRIECPACKHFIEGRFPVAIGSFRPDHGAHQRNLDLGVDGSRS